MSQSTDSVLNSLPYRADYIDSLPGYNTWIGNIERLDLVRDIINSNGYRYQGVVFPTRELIVSSSYATYGIPPFSQQDGSVVVGRGAVLVSVAAFCSNSQGFKFGIFDQSTKDAIIEGNTIRAELFGFTQSTDPIDGVTQYYGQTYIGLPYVLTGNGVVSIRVNNLSNGYNIAQVIANFAVPRNNVTKTLTKS